MAEEDETRLSRLEALEREVSLRGELATASARQLSDLQEEIQSLENVREVMGHLNDTDQAALDLAMRRREEIADTIASYKALQNELSNLNKKISELESVGETAAGQLKDLSRAFGVPKNFEKSLTGSIIKLGMMTDSTEDGRIALNAFKKDMGASFTMANMSMAAMGAIITATQDAVMFLFKNLKDVAISFDEMRASINKNILSGQAYVEIAKQSSIENMHLGVTADVAGEAHIALAKNLDLATDSNKSFAKELGTTVSKMAVLGADTTQTTGILAFFQRGLKQTAAQTKGTTMEVFKLAKGLRTNLSTAFDQLSQAMPTLAAHGDRMMEVFKDLATQARASGASIQTLLSVAGKFDQFGSGAQAAAALNSLLGGALLNSTELLRMSESERLKTIISTIQAQGIAFKDMDRFKQKAIASAVGITDMAEANKLFGMSMTEYEGYTNQVEQAAATQRSLDEAVSKALPVIQQLQLAVSKFVAEYGDVIQNILDGTLDLAKSFLVWKKSGSWFEGWGLAVISVGVGIAATFGVVLAMMLKVGAAMAGLTAAAGGLATALAGGGALAGGAAAAGGIGLLPILAGIAAIAGVGYLGYKAFSGDEKVSNPTVKALSGGEKVSNPTVRGMHGAQRAVAAPQAAQAAPSNYVIETATLDLTFSAEETVRLSKILTNVGLKANGLS